MPGQAQPDGKTRIWPLVSGLAFFLIIVSVVPAWMLWKSGTFRKHPPHVISKTPPEAPRQEHVPAKLSELHGEGEVYLVPIGDQVIAPKSLLQHYKSKFNLTIQLLPQLPVEQKTFDAQRKQYIAEEMIEQMTLAHPDLDKDPNAVMIALTSEDIYPRSSDSEYVCTYRAGQSAVVSTHRMSNASQGVSADPELARRLQHMLTMDIAMLHYNLVQSADPESVLYPVVVPDEKPDDIWESDVHPEDSVYGLTGDRYCLRLTYSYRTSRMMLDPGGMDCSEGGNIDSEAFLIEPGDGNLSLYKTDFSLGGKPEIVFVREYVHGNEIKRAFGMGGDHFYDTDLVTDNPAVMDEMVLASPVGGGWHFKRTSPGRGFSPDMVFINKDEGVY